MQEAVKGATSVLELRQALGRLEEGLNADYVSPAFHRRPLLVKGAWLPTGAWGSVCVCVLWWVWRGGIWF